MKKNFLFLGDSITDADHLFEPSGLGYGYVRALSATQELQGCLLKNRGHDGFTIEQIWRMLCRDGIEPDWDVITILAGVNDIPVEVYTAHPRIPQEFQFYYEKILKYLKENTKARLILVEPFLFDSPREYLNWFPLLDTERAIIHKLASVFDTLFLPMVQTLRLYARTQGTDKITFDGIHLTPLGNQILARHWLELCKKDGILS